MPSVVGPGEAFFLEVTVPVGSTTSIALVNAPSILVGGTTVTFVDNGTGRDRVAGDGVFTSGPLWFSTVSFVPKLPGLGFMNLGTLRATLPNATTRDFQIDPYVGVLTTGSTRLPVSQTADRAATDRIVEACTAGWKAQGALRGYDISSMPGLTSSLYGVVDDDVDHWVWFSTQHLEITTLPAPDNSATGRHWDVWRQFTGSQLGPYDNRASYGTTKLRSINFLDHGERGVYAANVTHEILHSWGAYLSFSLGLVEGTGHYDPRSSVGSILGGFKWDLQPNGTYTRDCTQGRNGANQASPLDLYFMGLLPASSVPTLRVAPSNQPLAGCGQPVPTPQTQVTVQQIIAAHGAVTPGPGQAPVDYRVGFAVEAAGRRLTSNEREFYHRLAEAYGAPIPQGTPAPYVGADWASVAAFFPGSTWRTNLTPH